MDSRHLASELMIARDYVSRIISFLKPREADRAGPAKPNDNRRADHQWFLLRSDFARCRLNEAGGFEDSHHRMREIYFM